MLPHRPLAAPRAFTLVELLTVISVILLLIVILMPSLRRAREQARSVACLANLRELGHATTIYTDRNRGALPVSPAEKIAAGQGDDGRMVAVTTTCHWGGRRAEWLHPGPGDVIAPEAEKRPLTSILYRNADLDSPTPVFRCPSDRPTDWSNSLISGANIYRVCGNSYYINMFGTSPFPNAPRQTPTADIVLYMEAPLYEMLSSAEQRDGWHRRFATHNVLFLDMHAATTKIDSSQRSGDGWAVDDFQAMSGFYP